MKPQAKQIDTIRAFDPSPSVPSVKSVDKFPVPDTLAAFFAAIQSITVHLPREMAELRAAVERMHDIITNDPRLKRGGLRTKEAAAYIGVSLRTFERIAIDFEVPHTKLGTLKIWQRPDLDELLAKYRTKGK